MNQLILERDETWGNLPVHILEAQMDFDRPLVMAALPGRKRYLVPALEFALDDDWQDAFKDHLGSVKDTVCRLGYEDIKPDEYLQGQPEGCVVILRTPTKIHCAAMVFPFKVTLENLILLTTADAVVPPDGVCDEVWEGTPVHLIKVPGDLESSVWIEFEGEDSRKFLSMFSTGISLHQLKSRRAIVPQILVPPEMNMFNLKYMMKELVTTAKDPWNQLEPLGLAHYGLVVSTQRGSCLAVALLPEALKVGDVLLTIPATDLFNRA